MPLDPRLAKITSIIKKYNEMGCVLVYASKIDRPYAVFMTEDKNYIFHDGEEESRISSMRLYAIARAMCSDRFVSSDLSSEEMKLFESFPDGVTEAGSQIGFELGLFNKENERKLVEAMAQLFKAGSKNREEAEKKMSEAAEDAAFTY